MNLPTCYTDENAPEANKAVYKEYQRIINNLKESIKTTRKCVLNQFGIKIWEESEEEYQTRMNELFYEVK